MLAFLYKNKKELRKNIGKPLKYRETSMFGLEYKDNGVLTGVLPNEYERKYFANVTMENGLIKKVK